MNRFQQALAEKKILIADGATGTMLQRAGLPIGAAPERWVLENPAAVQELHQKYLEAGADLILTTTFGGTRIRLARENLGDQVSEINRRAAKLARAAAGEKALVAGDMGPTGQLLAPYGTLTAEEAEAAFAEQAQALVEGGVDLILIETMGSLEEIKAALAAVRKVTEVPVLASMSFDTRGRTMMGVKPETAALELATLADGIGANCGRTLTETLDAVQKMHAAAPQALLLAKPNAGLPHIEGGQAVYDVAPEVMGEYALKFIDSGVRIIGGCCGSTPEHIRAIATAIRSNQ